MEADMAAAVAVFEARHRVRETVARGPVQMLGTSGTVTTLAGVHKELRRYDRAAVDGSYLDMAIVRAISERIGAMSQAERAAHPCIGPERADLVIAGCAILSRSEEHTSELQSLMRISYAVFCLNKKNTPNTQHHQD